VAWLVIVETSKGSIGKRWPTWFRPWCLAPSSYEWAMGRNRELGSDYCCKGRSGTDSDVCPSKLSVLKPSLAVLSHGNSS
jgi:hypothetical protein